MRANPTGKTLPTRADGGVATRLPDHPPSDAGPRGPKRSGEAPAGREAGGSCAV